MEEFGSRILIGLILGAVSLFFTLINGVFVAFVLGWVKNVNKSIEKLAENVVDAKINNAAVDKEIALIRQKQDSGIIKIAEVQKQTSKLWEVVSAFAPKRESDKIMDMLKQSIHETEKGKP